VFSLTETDISSAEFSIGLLEEISLILARGSGSKTRGASWVLVEAVVVVFAEIGFFSAAFRG